MGASESLLSRQQLQQPRPQWADEITTVSEGRRDDADADPLVRRIRSLTIVRPELSCLLTLPADAHDEMPFILTLLTSVGVMLLGICRLRRY